MLSKSFSTGQIFGYWPSWKNDTKQSSTRDLFNGSNITQCYVPPSYTTLKDEITNSSFVSVKEWNIHHSKAQRYKNTIKVKSLRCATERLGEEYGIRYRANISLDHLLCVILYCDTNELQADFASTFRKKSPFETLDEIKHRHSKYHHFAKGLIEAIHVYGIERVVNTEQGPFYCGLNCILSIGEFAVYLKSPTSTSVDIEIAIRFATEDGIILQLNNDTEKARDQKMFDCSWISAYPEENERLFIGYDGMNKLRIQSVTIMQTNMKYEQFSHAMWVFDCICSGESIKRNNSDIKKSDISTLSLLINNKIGNDTTNDIDEYILQCFDLYILNKINITLSISEIYDCIYRKNELSLPVLLNDLQLPEERESFTTYATRWGLSPFHSNIFKLFKNAKHIEINMVENYEFTLLSLLSVTESGSRDIGYKITAKSVSWLKQAVTSSVILSYGKKKWDIRYESINDPWTGYHDCVFINQIK